MNQAPRAGPGKNAESSCTAVTLVVTVLDRLSQTGLDILLWDDVSFIGFKDTAEFAYIHAGSAVDT